MSRITITTEHNGRTVDVTIEAEVDTVTLNGDDTKVVRDNFDDLIDAAGRAAKEATR